MKKRTKRNILNVAIIMTYLTLIGLLVFSGLSLNDKYNKEEIKAITRIEWEIKEALEKNDSEAITKALDKAREQDQFDIVVIEGKEVIYKSIPFQFGDTLLSRVHEGAVTRVSQGEYKTSTNTYKVWYSVYKLSESDFLAAYIVNLLWITIFATLLLALTVFLIFRNLFDPLRTVKKSIKAAQDYDFENIKDEEDTVNRNFKKFANRLESDITAVSRQQTELETQLQMNREHLKNAMVVSRSMIHDLKTPVHQSIIENDISEREHQDLEDLVKVTQRNQEINEGIIQEINTILKMLRTESTVEPEITEIDLVTLITKAITRFKSSLQDKDLYVNFDAPEEAVIKTEESAMILLINNLLSNMTQYTQDHSELFITIDQTNNQIMMRFENPANKEDIKRMKKTEQLFNTVENPNTEKYEYSSGNGLYLIKDLTHMIGGTYSLNIKNDHVIIEVVLDNEN